MSKFVYSVCPDDDWPHLETVVASGILEAEEKVINKYYNMFEIDNNSDDFHEFVEEMNVHGVVISDLYDIEEL